MNDEKWKRRKKREYEGAVKRIKMRRKRKEKEKAKKKKICTRRRK
jgi:hypothetical protein